MAKYTKTCKDCGKTISIQLFGKHKQREYELSLIESCRDVGEDCQERSPDLDWAK